MEPSRAEDGTPLPTSTRKKLNAEEVVKGKKKVGTKGLNCPRGLSHVNCEVGKTGSERQKLLRWDKGVLQGGRGRAMKRKKNKKTFRSLNVDRNKKQGGLRGDTERKVGLQKGGQGC